MTTSTSATASDDLLAQQHAESEQLLTAERERLLKLDAELSEHLTELARLLTPEPVETNGSGTGLLPPKLQRKVEELEQQTEQLQRRARSLVRVREELTECQERLSRQQQQSAESRAAAKSHWAAAERDLAARREALHLSEAALAKSHSQLAAETAQLAVLRRQLDAVTDQLAAQHAELDRERIQTHRQRRRIAVELRQRRAELQQAAAGHSNHDAATLGNGSPGDEILASEFGELQRERDRLAEQLAAAQEQIATQSHTAGEPDKATSDKLYELQRRFEMAVEDMRKYKHRVAELEAELERKPAAPRPMAATGGQDWESQKNRLLASLEDDMGGNGEREKQDRLTVEGAVRITDEVVAERDAEIARLKHQILELTQERTARSDDATASANANATMLDQDATVAAERQRLLKLEAELLDRQRVVEVEMALDRAKIARERVELEDRLHGMKSEMAQRGESSGTQLGRTEPAKGSRGRWLARLGLKDSSGE
ncbi:MAG: hypothetical protein K8T25_13485 [Planctomycetia bacterium]|nr:hypothetical protein [Planctomycetia bacterium]